MNCKKIFIVNGMAGSGKDTFVDIVAKYIPTKHISIVDKAKEYATLMGWTGTKFEKDRKFLCDLKHLIDEYNDSNYSYIIKEVEQFMKDDTLSFLFIDMCEINQIIRARKEFNASTVLVKRPNIHNVTTNFADAQTLDSSYEYNFVIVNDGTLGELEDTAVTFIDMVMKDVCKQDIKTSQSHKNEQKDAKEDDSEFIKMFNDIFGSILGERDLKGLLQQVKDALNWRK